MTTPLDEKALAQARSTFAMENSLERAIRAYLAASPSPSEMEVVAWRGRFRPADSGYEFPWEYSQKDPSIYCTFDEVQPLVTLSSAQSSLSAMAAERDAAEEAENEAKDCFWAVYPTYCEVKGHGISTEAARTELAAQVQRITEENEALRKEREALTYSSAQSTRCPCGNVQHTPLRRDHMGGYVCLTCIDKELDRLREMEVSAEARIKALEEALEQITRHPIETPVGGRPSLGIPAWPSCQEIARTTLQKEQADG